MARIVPTMDVAPPSCQPSDECDNLNAFMMAAATYGHADSVRALHEIGADANAKNDLVHTGCTQYTGYTAIMLAAESGRTETVKVLHELGADPNGRSSRESGEIARCR